MHAPVPYQVDPDDPRAPPQDVWDDMATEERQRVVEALPSEFFWAWPPEGDPHFLAKVRAREALQEYFRRTRRRVYLASELPVYYPDEARFAPDLMAVLDVDLRERMRWVVSDEGRGLDFALEITLGASAKKDFVDNVVRCARVGIPEYFVLDRRRPRLAGYRLAGTGATTYEPIMPQQGRWPSQVLGLELALEGDRLRFFSGTAPLLEASELIDRLGGMEDEVVRREEQALQRADEEHERAHRLAARLRALGVDPDEA